MKRPPSACAAANIALLMGVALMSACAVNEPYERPAAPVAQAWPGANATDTAFKAAAAISWQNYFNDERLKLLIDAALKNNRDLRVATLNIEQARTVTQLRRADLLPAVNAGASVARTTVAPGSLSTAYSAGLTVTAWELDFFGRINNLKDSALALYLASEESRKAVQISLIASVANAHLNLLVDEELLGLTRQTLKTRDDSFKLTQLRFDNGVSSELDLRQAQSLSEGARATLAQLQRQRAQDENALVLLLGQPLPAAFSLPAMDASLSAATPLQMAPVMVDLPAGLPSDLLVSRPDVRAAEQQLIAANGNVGAARAAFFPRFSLTAGLGFASTDLSSLLQSGSLAWTPSLQALLPIFDAGRNQANLDAAKTSRSIAIAQYEKAIQSAFREVADGLAARASFTEQLRAQQAQADAEAARYKLSDLRYRNGVASYLDLLDAQRSLFAARQAVVLTRLAQLQNQVVLYKALGGGWE